MRRRFSDSSNLPETLGRCLSCSRNGEVLRHPLDTSLDNVCKFMSEWNLRDVADFASDSHSLLTMLRRRATTSLIGQYCGDPVSGARGDAGFIPYMMERRNLQNANLYKDRYTLLLDVSQYG